MGRAVPALCFFVGLGLLATGTCQAQQTDAQMQEITRQCVAQVKQRFPMFDAYFEPRDRTWRILQNQQSQNQQSAFDFRRCLLDHGITPR
jgi:hypothetical protein